MRDSFSMLAVRPPVVLRHLTSALLLWLTSTVSGGPSAQRQRPAASGPGGGPEPELELRNPDLRTAHRARPPT
ncbi:RNA polymerase II holoenzyme cyclin-like subunit [Frankliniella fusca]|uniref:RNA polymerase II holoenzyme cyclin-like subunit n=1 Tax=Frankliniella fusca TaxID=407009 RepID=A0AAE1HZK5_9NEOP|nr:RNA polymerase II holoenzyme cyclin-like subunit [Frankliniella fusca]